jgi:ABC-type multidrug transport system ATPase subunit
MRGRTVILVSHHVQLCAPGASYIVTLDNGQVQFQGGSDEFRTSGAMNGLVQSGQADDKDYKETMPAVTVEEVIPEALQPDSSSNSDGDTGPNSETSSTAVTTVASESKPGQKKAPRKLVEEETRAVGRISRNIWKTYILACGAQWYWSLFLVVVVLAAISPVAENWWLK